ncbi:hypothetical protein OEZ85_010388 [Tetradesmus obliquus]|uniref:Helicase C-terminal domain-containing protein n=1 Tax=Tetradesmus obliquus TaxID=3088 RepID=A0ABY8TMG1_TETOB|nr:hypothetical protein OEZ85_010388 [Tetradesmus obliquus]
MSEDEPTLGDIAAGMEEDAAAEPAAAAAAGTQTAAAAPAAPEEPAAELLHCAYGRVAVLYASWTKPSQVDDYKWDVEVLTTPGQVAARAKLVQQQKDAEQQLLAAYRDQAPFLDIIAELQALATVTRIRGIGNAPGVRHRPSVAVSLELQQGGRGKPAREGSLKITVWAWLASSCPSRDHRTVDSVPGEAAHSRPWEISQIAARAAFKVQWVNTITTVEEHDREGMRIFQTRNTPSWRQRAPHAPSSKRVLLKQSSGLPLSATLLALLQQQPGGDASCFEEWLGCAAEWDAYVKREKEAGSLLLHLLKTGPQAAARQPRGFAPGLTLKQHQLEALSLMQAAEQRPLGFNSVVWKEVTLGGRRWWLSPLLGKMSSEAPPKQATGGILAQDMGCGKTICCLAIILANTAPQKGPGNTAPGAALPADESEQQQDADDAEDGEASCQEESEEEEEEGAGASAAPPNRLLYSRATLVVCAVSLVGQWADEAAARTNGSLRILQYHGSGRYKYTAAQLAADYDVVVTTYNTLGTEHGGKRGRFSETGSPLCHIKWWRVIFDEGHVLKCRGTIQSRAACSLASDRRWVVTGTPIDTDVTDVYGLLLGLQVWPFTESRFAAQHCLAAFKGKALEASLCSNSRQVPLFALLKGITVRHTKEVLQLPPKTVEDVPVYLNADERRHYRTALRNAKQQWEALKHVGGNARLQAHALLQPMRRICSGGKLPERALQVTDFAAAARAREDARLQRINALLYGTAAPAVSVASNALGGSNADDTECCICLDAPEEPVASPCRCPECSSPLTLGVLKPVEPRAAAAAGAGPAAAVAAPSRAPRAAEQGPFVVCDSKLLKLKEELVAMRAADPGAKALIFSSFTATIQQLQEALPGWGYSFRFINGHMPMQQRTRAIEAFQKDPPTTVFILTLRSAACGIDLTAASHVFLLEPCLNAAVEAQAIGRAWRMGQSRNVVVKRLFVKGSIEERTMELATTAADRLQRERALHIGTLKGDNYSLWKDNMGLLLEDYSLPPPPAALPGPRPAAGAHQGRQHVAAHQQQQVEEHEEEEEAQQEESWDGCDADQDMEAEEAEEEEEESDSFCHDNQGGFGEFEDEEEDEEFEEEEVEEGEELMTCLGYCDDEADAAEAKLMAVAQQAVTANAAAANGAAVASTSVAAGDSAADGEVAVPAGVQVVAAQRWLHQFNSGVLRRHVRLVKAVAGRGGASAGGAEAVGAGLRAWIDSNLMGAGQQGV